MREIKIRAWQPPRDSGLEGTMYFPQLFVDERGVVSLSGDEGGRLMQFTGLLDKNGKEIYEGDVVKMRDEVFEVFYCDTTASFRRSGRVDGKPHYQMLSINLIREGDGEYRGDDKGKYFEVLGNIYENPELLKQ